MRNLWVIDNSCIEFLVYIRQAYITRSGQTEWSIQWCQVFESWFRWGTNLLGWFPYLKKHCHGVLLNFELRARIFRVGFLLILDTYIYQTLAQEKMIDIMYSFLYKMRNKESSANVFLRNSNHLQSSGIRHCSLFFVSAGAAKDSWCCWYQCCGILSLPPHIWCGSCSSCMPCL